MNVLDFQLDDRSFDDLVEAARSRLPAQAPDWTDYNLHDPGITLIELMAWLGEAQIWSLSRLRRDERQAYAAFAGVVPAGPRAARGLVWPDLADPSNALNTQVRPLAIGDANPIRPTDADHPACRVAQPTLLVPGRITALTTALSGGARIDQTATNARGQVAWLPFGADAGPRDVLQIAYACASPGGLADRAAADLGAWLSLGIRVDGTPRAVVPAARPDAIEATLIIGTRRWPLAIGIDGSAGMRRSGVIGLVLPPRLPPAPAFAIELRAPRGFACAPRLRQVALNVVAIEQSVTIAAEAHLATGQVDQRIALDDPSLRSNGGLALLRVDGGAAPPRVEVEAGGRRDTWRALPRLDEAGPDDMVYVLDATAGGLQFGNGVNGRVPPAGAQVFVAYSICDGVAGNQPRPRAWFAAGLGPLGRNVDPLQGGSDAETLLQARGEARRAVRDRHAVATADDLVAAALAQADLQVARALVLPFARGADTPGDVTLIALRRRGTAASAQPEPPRWLDALRAVLQPRLPLGQRLSVRGPVYVDFALTATLQAAPQRDVATIQAAALAELARRLNPIAAAPGDTERALGAALTTADIGAWLRRLDGVAAVIALTLRNAANQAVDIIDVGPQGLPRFDASTIAIDVQRSTTRGRT